MVKHLVALLRFVVDMITREGAGKGLGGAVFVGDSIAFIERAARGFWRRFTAAAGEGHDQQNERGALHGINLFFAGGDAESHLSTAYRWGGWGERTKP